MAKGTHSKARREAVKSDLDVFAPDPVALLDDADAEYEGMDDAAFLPSGWRFVDTSVEA